jgi:predicted ATPase/GAF domain-containing protein/anti-anti-sigma regulatory factor/tRNA A-37 threonylcarbamoyl transferase component Bud32
MTMTELAGYTLTERLHVGPHAVLHRGYRNADREPVVVKLPGSDRPSPRETARVRHEYLICRDLDASGAVRAYALEGVGQGLALVLEDFGGQPLSDLLRAGRLDLEKALQIAAALADALGAVHEQKIIHKDIKPQNVFINPATGVVKLTDFGIATRLSQEASKEAPPRALEGTLSYMSPEQTGRMNRVLDYRTDFYSLGVTLYEMLTGVLPFAATEPIELVHSHIARTPPSPRERVPELPAMVSAIVMKLLAKAAEDRYQSAYGLKADLDACLSRSAAGQAIEPFRLGQKDAAGVLRVAQKLYGREVETATLLAAFERASAGGAELLLVSGYAGVGKSALVSEIHQAIGRKGGLFGGGKFDQLSRNVPYTAVAAALQGLVRQLLAGPEEALARGRRDLLAAVGGNGRLLADLIPELTLLIGPQPAVPELGPTESQNRFAVVFQSFLRVFSTPEHPLVLFLDDLQWADPASLKLLSLLLSDPERGHLLIVGAYRDHEVGRDHLLSLTLAELRKGGARVSEIALQPLDLAGVTDLVADTLGAGRAEVQPLARLAFDKTHGNPFFLGQLLQSLHAGGQIFFDRQAGAWAWDLEGIEAADVTDNVVDLMAGKIARLAPETRRVLLLAACIGHEFDLKSLSVISELSPRATAAALWQALREGLALPLDAEYRFLDGAADEGAPPTPASVFDVSYRFLHDRVQQAAYSQLDDGQRQAVHLRIGRLLRDQGDEKEHEGRLFAVVDHLNLGAALIDDRAERLELARANLAAGRRAKAATAYQAALGYLEAAAALVDEACWQGDYALAFELGVEQTECLYLNARFEPADALSRLLLARAESKTDRAQVYKLVIVFATARGDFAGAIRFGRAGLALFDLDLPEGAEAQRAARDAELAAIESNLAGRPIAELARAPLIDAEHRIPLELLVLMSPASFFSGPPLDSLISSLQTNLCLKHGRSDLAAFAYAYASITQVTLLGRYEEGREFFRVSCALDEEFDNVALRGKTNVILVSVAHFFISFRAVLPYVALAQRAALETGDFLFLAFTCYHDVMPRFCAGEPLGSLAEVLQKSFALARRTGNGLVLATLDIARQLIAALQGRTAGRTLLGDGDYDEAAHLAEMEGAGNFGFALSWRHTIKLMLCCLHEDHEGALAEAARAEATAGATAVFHFSTDVPFYEGLSLAALLPSAPAEEAGRYAARLSECRAKIATWAESCPENYGYKRLLLDAEAARIAGEHAVAQGLYDEAIDAARDGAITHHEALANELAARHYFGRGRENIARLYLREAYQGYLLWGATEKAAALAERYPESLGAALSPRPSGRDAAVEGGEGEGGRGLDATTIVRAAQAFASEIVLDRLLDRLMRIAVENAGADRGVLMLCRDEGTFVEATLTVEPDLVRVGLGAPLDGEVELATSVVHFVRRANEPVVLGDAARGGPFAADPYLLARPPKSLLCLPMTHKGRVAGVLYLENRAVRDAFTPARCEVVGLLLSQAAIAVENALLVTELTRRSQALGEANEALRAANERLERELRERERAEQMRAELKGELVLVQTPFIPITDQIAVMPLIGNLDVERARQVLETALREVEASRAKVVILDVTGVKDFDAGAVSKVVSATRALRLLGAQAMMTGIRPGMARSLIELSLDLEGVVTQGTLQSGIAYAMERLGGGRRGP